VDCYLDKAYLGNLYAWLDIAGMFVFFVALVWLFHFEKQEELDLEKVSMYASSFAIEVSNLPDECTEDEVKDHFEALSNEKVSYVTIVYDSESEIKAYKKRCECNLSMKLTKFLHIIFNLAQF